MHTPLSLLPANPHFWESYLPLCFYGGALAEMLSLWTALPPCEFVVFIGSKPSGITKIVRLPLLKG